MNEDQKKALAYLAQALQELSATLPSTVRGPFIAECNRALDILDPKPPKE